MKVANKLDARFSETESILRNEEKSRQNQADTCRKSSLTAPNGVLSLLCTTAAMCYLQRQVWDAKSREHAAEIKLKPQQWC